MTDSDIIRINCQFCEASLGILTEDVPNEGKSITCPSCRKSFLIKKSQFEKSFTYSMHCPKCGMLQDPSEECIHCNVIIAKFLKYKKHESAWEILSKRFITKDSSSEKAGPPPNLQDLIVSCPNCGFSKNMSKDKCPTYITRIGCPGCDQSFDIINWINMGD